MYREAFEKAFPLDEIFSFDYISVGEVFNCHKDLHLALPGFHKLITRSRNDDNY